MSSQARRNNQRIKQRYSVYRGRITEPQWQKIKARFDFHCVGCCLPETPARPLTIDHVVPLAHGGSNHKRNIQPLCKTCNDTKGESVVDYRKDFELRRRWKKRRII